MAEIPFPTTCYLWNHLKNGRFSISTALPDSFHQQYVALKRLHLRWFDPITDDTSPWTAEIYSSLRSIPLEKHPTFCFGDDWWTCSVPSMGLVYLPTLSWFFMANVGKYPIPGNSFCPFWDGEFTWPFQKLSDLQRLVIKRSRIESPGTYPYGCFRK